MFVRFSAYLFLLVLERHLEPGERVACVVLFPAFAEHRLDLLGAATQVHQLVGEVHALLDQTEVLVLLTNTS